MYETRHVNATLDALHAKTLYDRFKLPIQRVPIDLSSKMDDG